MRQIRNQKGITLVLAALMLFALIMIGGMATDIAYMYLAKNATQVAADAGALAGAGHLSEPYALNQQPARDEAVKFCSANKVAGQPMTIASNSGNTLSDGNDVTVGYFNSATQQYTPGLAVPGTTWPNAIEVRTRRTQNSPVGPVGVFLGKVGGWRKMSAASVAIAGRLPRPGAPLALCINPCSWTPADLPKDLYFKESSVPTPGQGVAWTNLSTTSNAQDLGPGGEISKILRGELTVPDVCCEKIYLNNGIGQVTKELQDKFAAEAAKTGGYWDVLVPIVGQVPPDCPSQTELKGCPPGVQKYEPYLVTKYAEVRITAVYPNPAPGIRISQIRCVSCPADELFGNHAMLLK